ncbi:MAG: alpha/beta hydrolase, partial [Clostridia bacterium]
LAKRLFVVVDKLFDGQQNRRKDFRFNDKDIVVKKDIVYDKSNEAVCRLDTYHIEKKSGKYPVCFEIHGGGFVAGDKEYRRAQSGWLAKNGYFVVNANYALSPEYKFPEGAINLVKALNWVGENAEKLNLDLNNMVVTGDSAGGYYSALLASICNSKDLQKRIGVSTDLKFRAAVFICGIYDVVSALDRKMPFNLTDKICFDFSGVHTNGFATYQWKDLCSPLDLVTKDFPISFVSYANKDIFCKGQGQVFIEKLKKEGVHVESFNSKKLLDNHCFSLGWKSKASRENNRLIEDFLKRIANREL